MMSSDGEHGLPAIVEEALSRIQVLLQTLFEAADDAIVLMDGPRFVDCNPSTLRMFGIPAKRDLLGETSIRLSPARQPDGSSSDDKAHRLIAAAIAGDPQHVEWQFRRLDDSLFDVEISLHRCLVGGAPFLLAVARDITSRKRAEAALLQEKRFSERLIEALPGTFYLYDAQLRLCRWNKNHETQMGYTADELRGKPIAELAATEHHRAQLLTAAHRLIERGEVVEVQETLLQHKDGSAVPYMVSGVRIDAPEGPMILGVGLDISDRRRAALERERLMGELQAANRAKDEFMAVLSHELRTPLAAIQASIDLLLLLPPLGDPRAMSALRTIERNVKLQTRLVNDLLDMSRLMRGKLTIERAPVRLGEVVLAAAETCRGDAARAEVALEARAEAGLWADADATRIQQMVINLVDNAIKFTPRGGRVTVSVTARDRHGYVVVEDTGVGIAPDRLSDIFEMFRQGEVAARRAPGLGIGLALVKSIVDLHGCRVWAESPGPGRGSRFVVELPLYEAPPGRAVRRAAGRSVLTLLLVEDNDDTRTMLTETLSQLDYAVLAADTAEVALEILGRQPVDVIVADMGLPGMDGYELLRAARRLPAAARVPAVALTGYGQDSDVRRAREAGYAQHLVKPTDVDVLDEQIRALVDGRIAHGGSP